VQQLFFIVAIAAVLTVGGFAAHNKLELPVGDKLENLLVEATHDCINDEKYVRIDHMNKTIILSTIFNRFERDFTNKLRRRGHPVERGSLDNVIAVAAEPLKWALGEARGYDVVFSDYDWSLDSQDNSWGFETSHCLPGCVQSAPTNQENHYETTYRSA
jgi:hypothetical protein